MDKKKILLVLTLVISSALLGICILGQKASALSGSEFRAGRIIDDAVFFNGGAMSVTQVQNFLNAKVPSCDTWGTKPSGHSGYPTRADWGRANGAPPPYTCLKSYRQNVPFRAGESGLCGQIDAKSSQTAAQIIDTAARACGISQKVLIVLLQKEQSLVTDDWPWPVQYRSATGYGCPDTAPCDSEYYGFFNQVYKAAWVYKWYAANNGPNYFKNRNNIIKYHPNSSCGSSTVYIENQATAGLYNYTPYRPNAAALNNLYGTGDGCSSYGNRNFWRLFNNWFGSTLGSPFFRINNSEAVYMLGASNNFYYVPNWTTLYSYGYGKTTDRIVSVSSNYIAGRVNSGSLPPIARFEGSAIYLVDDGKSHHFTSPEMFSRYGYSIGEEAKLPDWTKLYVPQSTDIQSVVKQSNGDPVYLIENGRKRHFIDGDAYNTGSPAYSSLTRVNLHGRYLSSFPNGAPILTANKLLRRADTNTYAFWDGSSLQELNAQVIKELRLSPDYTSVSGAINFLNRSGTGVSKLAKSSAGQLYIFDSGFKYSVDTADLADLGFTSADFVTTSDGFLSRTSTQPFYKAVRVNNGTKVFMIDSGQRHHFVGSPAVYENGLSMEQVKSLNGSTASLFPDSGKVILSIGQLFRIGTNAQVFVVTGSNSRVYFPSRAIFDQYGFSISNVTSLSESQVSGYTNLGQIGYIIKDVSGNVWAVEGGGKKHTVSLTMQNASNYNLNVSSLKSVSLAFVNRLDASSSLTNLLQVPKDPKVYKIDNGQRRWVTSREAFDSNGYIWSKVLQISKPFLESLPLGPQIN